MEAQEIHTIGIHLFEKLALFDNKLSSANERSPLKVESHIGRYDVNLHGLRS